MFYTDCFLIILVILIILAIQVITIFLEKLLPHMSATNPI